MMQSPLHTTPKRRRVSFCDEIVHISPIIPSEACAVIPSGHLWYTKAELSIIKRAVANLLIHRAMDETNSKVDHDDPDFWGLERHGLERHHSKKAAIKMVLMAQNMNESKTDPEFLRNVSLHCSKKALDLAREQGFRDSCCADYDESLEKIVDDCIFDWSMPSIVRSKRSTSTASFSLAEDHRRRVRSRVSAA